MTSSKPVIGIVCCHKIVDNQPSQNVYEKYTNAIHHYGGTPILLPHVIVEEDSFEPVMSMLDGILLTGSYSNVAPARYKATHKELKQDLTRDELSFKLLDYAKNKQLPLLAICRGLQEMNVYFGGTLHPDWREVGCYFEQHLEDSNAPLEVQYQPIHDVIINGGGHLSSFNNKWKVNSLHKQCINKVGEDLFVEATAPDTLIEAISLPKHPFLLGVQWHPEADYAKDEMSKYLFSGLIKHAKQARSIKG
ncbi:gamma-glutamyl-gamma-aminobutyrate hydrolase [Psychrobacter lutiphocae]|uniref:gamma-glutamyl-gamma-aminobutyrate hydrolase n=1 Tax=Psychrobacter lutiphocae TaxID=540500 RepID=UPI000375186B|nr:gamma-glutamyl-gamma-aminobutyrate hydrolase [Psychrobacter lutiphocae]